MWSIHMRMNSKHPYAHIFYIIWLLIVINNQVSQCLVYILFVCTFLDELKYRNPSELSSICSFTFMFFFSANQLLIARRTFGSLVNVKYLHACPFPAAVYYSVPVLKCHSLRSLLIYYFPRDAHTIISSCNHTGCFFILHASTPVLVIVLCFRAN